MLSRRDLEPLLLHAEKETSPVLSLYLDVDLARTVNRNRGFQVAARSLMAGLRDEIDSGTGGAELSEDLARVEEFLAGYTPDGKSLALFCDASERLLWHRTLPIALHPDARYRPAPYLRPLIETLDEQERYGLVLLDRQQARLFSVFLGAIEEIREAFAPLDVRTSRTTGTDHLWSEKRFRRRADSHAHLHIKQVAGLLRDLQRRIGFDRLVIAGPLEATAELQRLLPRPLLDRVAAVWKLPVDTRESDLLRDVVALQERREEEHDHALVEELIEGADGGRQATVGMAPTLEALRQGRVLRLAYVVEEPVEGGVCASCDTLSQRADGPCGFCQAPIRKVRDLVARMGRQVADSGGRLDRVRGPAADRLRGRGGAGALLRF